MIPSWTERFTVGKQEGADTVKPIPVLPPVIDITSENEEESDHKIANESSGGDGELSDTSDEDWRPRKRNKRLSKKKAIKKANNNVVNEPVPGTSKGPTRLTIDPAEVDTEQSTDHLIGSKKRLQSAIEMITLSIKTEPVDEEEFSVNDLYNNADWQGFSANVKVEADKIVEKKAPEQTFAESTGEEDP